MRIREENPETNTWVQVTRPDEGTIRLSVGEDDFVADSMHLNLEDTPLLLNALLEVLSKGIDDDAQRD